MAASGRKFGLDGSTVRAKAEVDMVLDEAADVRNVIFYRKIDIQFHPELRNYRKKLLNVVLTIFQWVFILLLASKPSAAQVTNLLIVIVTPAVYPHLSDFYLETSFSL